MDFILPLLSVFIDIKLSVLVITGYLLITILELLILFVVLSPYSNSFLFGYMVRADSVLDYIPIR